MNKKLKLAIVFVAIFLLFTTTDVMAKKELIAIEKGNSYQMVWEIRRYQSNNRKIKFSVSDKEVVKVTKNGKVKGKKAGKSKITLYVKKDKKYVKKRTWQVIVKKEIPYSEQYDYHVYEENGQKYIEIDKYHSDNSIVKVPVSIDGIPVKKIGELCFPHDLDHAINEHVTKIVIPDGIEEIENAAMSGIHSLKQVVLPTTLNKIGTHMFDGSYQLEKVNYEEIFKFEEIPIGTFMSCRGFKEKIEIPSNVKKIGVVAFESSGITAVKLSKGIQIIDDYAFRYTKINKIMIPSTVSEIGRETFSYNNLKSIVIKAQNIKINKSAFTNINE